MICGRAAIAPTRVSVQKSSCRSAKELDPDRPTESAPWCRACTKVMLRPPIAKSRAPAAKAMATPIKLPLFINTAVKIITLTSAPRIIQTAIASWRPKARGIATASTGGRSAGNTTVMTTAAKIEWSPEGTRSAAVTTPLIESKRQQPELEYDGKVENVSEVTGALLFDGTHGVPHKRLGEVG